MMGGLEAMAGLREWGLVVGLGPGGRGLEVVGILRVVGELGVTVVLRARVQGGSCRWWEAWR